MRDRIGGPKLPAIDFDLEERARRAARVSAWLLRVLALVWLGIAVALAITILMGAINDWPDFVIFSLLAAAVGAAVIVFLEVTAQAVERGRFRGQMAARIVFYLHVPTMAMPIAIIGIIFVHRLKAGVGIGEFGKRRRWAIVAVAVLGLWTTTGIFEHARISELFAVRKQAKEVVAEDFGKKIQFFVVHFEREPNSFREFSDEGFVDETDYWRRGLLQRTEYSDLDVELYEPVFKKTLHEARENIPDWLVEAENLRQTFTAKGSGFSEQFSAFDSRKNFPPDSIQKAWRKQGIPKDELRQLLMARTDQILIPEFIAEVEAELFGEVSEAELARARDLALQLREETGDRVRNPSEFARRFWQSEDDRQAFEKVDRNTFYRWQSLANRLVEAGEEAAELFEKLSAAETDQTEPKVLN